MCFACSSSSFCFCSEIFNDIQLQDEPLELTVWDRDLYTSDDAIGTVLIDLNCVLTGTTGLADFGRGSRTLVFVLVLLLCAVFRGCGWHQRFLSDHGQLLWYFGASSLEDPYVSIEAIHGFVEELILEQDPEYHWSDSFRASRTSNDARLELFNTLSAKVTRNVGRKAIELGGNAVLGFRQKFDLEGEVGIVARASGTAVTIRKHAVGATLGNHGGSGGGSIASSAASPLLRHPPASPGVSGGSGGGGLSKVPEGSALSLGAASSSALGLEDRPRSGLLGDAPDDNEEENFYDRPERVDGCAEGCRFGSGAGPCAPKICAGACTASAAPVVCGGCRSRSTVVLASLVTPIVARFICAHDDALPLHASDVSAASCAPAA